MYFPQHTLAFTNLLLYSARYLLVLFALQDSSRRVRALPSLVFVFQGKRFNSKFATGLAVAGRRMFQCQLWIPALLGQLLVLVTSWEGLWPCLPCQGQAELTAPHPGCQHHSSSSAGFIIAADTAAGSLCEESLAHLETAATSLLGLL